MPCCLADVFSANFLAYSICPTSYCISCSVGAFPVDRALPAKVLKAVSRSSAYSFALICAASSSTLMPTAASSKKVSSTIPSSFGTSTMSSGYTNVSSFAVGGFSSKFVAVGFSVSIRASNILCFSNSNLSNLAVIMLI